LGIGFQPITSNPSCITFETDGHLALVDNNRDLARPIGMFQHDIQFAGIGNYIMILYIFSILCKCFPSCIGMRSGAFSENQDFFRHIQVPPSLVELAHYVVFPMIAVDYPRA
jgi:hypothetical protein